MSEHVIHIRVTLDPDGLDTNDFWVIRGPLGDAILDKLLELGIHEASVISSVNRDRDTTAKFLYLTYGHHVLAGPHLPEYEDLTESDRQEWESDAVDLLAELGA